MELDGDLPVLLKAQKMHLKDFTAMSPCRNHNPISQDNLQTSRTVRRSQVPEANQGKIRSTPPERWLYHLQSTDNVQGDDQPLKSYASVYGDLRCSPGYNVWLVTPAPIFNVRSTGILCSPHWEQLKMMLVLRKKTPKLIIVDKGCCGHTLLSSAYIEVWYPAITPLWSNMARM